MTAPIIGLTTYREEAAWGVWHQRADILPAQYAGAVEATGGVPLLLPPLAQEGAADAVVARIDGLVISGGADVDPERYGAEPHPRTAGWRPDRDAWESALLDAAEAAGAAGPRRVPRDAGDGGQRRRQARSAHARPGRSRTAQPGWRRVRRDRGDHRAGSRVSGLLGDTPVRQLPPPPVGAPTTPASSPPRTPPTAPSRRWRPTATGSASRSSGTPRPRPTSGLLAGLVRAAAAHADQRADTLHA